MVILNLDNLKNTWNIIIIFWGLKSQIFTAYRQPHNWGTCSEVAPQWGFIATISSQINCPLHAVSVSVGFYRSPLDRND